MYNKFTIIPIFLKVSEIFSVRSFRQLIDDFVQNQKCHYFCTVPVLETPPHLCTWVSQVSLRALPCLFGLCCECWCWLFQCSDDVRRWFRHRVCLLILLVMTKCANDETDLDDTLWTLMRDTLIVRSRDKFTEVCPCSTASCDPPPPKQKLFQSSEKGSTSTARNQFLFHVSVISVTLPFSFSGATSNFSRRFMKWNATIIVTLFSIFYPHELTKIVLKSSTKYYGVK